MTLLARDDISASDGLPFLPSSSCVQDSLGGLSSNFLRKFHFPSNILWVKMLLAGDSVVKDKKAGVYLAGDEFSFFPSPLCVSTSWGVIYFFLGGDSSLFHPTLCCLDLLGSVSIVGEFPLSLPTRWSGLAGDCLC